MKRRLLIFASLACALQAQAQGSLQFNAALTCANEVPPNNDPTCGTGSFSLSGNSLSFLVTVPAVTFISVSGSIQGPALPGLNAPIIFDLGGPVFHAGNDFGIPPYYAFGSPADPPFGAGPFTLTTDQINQLESGLWYVNVTSFTQPDGQLRGQILAVPEPSAFVLLALGGPTVLAVAGRRERRGGTLFAANHRCAESGMETFDSADKPYLVKNQQ